MSQPRPAITAAPDQSIWQGLNQSLFRKRIDDLRGKTRCPRAPILHTEKEWRGRAVTADVNTRILPFDVERRLADDLAFVAAFQKHVKQISSCALEERHDSSGVTIRLAANGGVEEAVVKSFRQVCELLQSCAKRREITRAL